jgi:hypothetical protein
MATEVSSQVLRVSGEIPINVTVTASAWGTGPSSRMLFVESNGSQLASGLVVATGITPFNNSKSTVRPQRLEWNLRGDQWADATEAVPAQAISIRTNAEPVSEPQVSCPDTWIVPQMTTIGDTEWSLKCGIAITQELRRRLASSKAKVESKIEIDVFGKQVLVPVTVTRESLIGFENAVVSFNKESNCTPMLIIEPRYGSSQRELRVGKVSTWLNGVSFVQDETEQFQVRLPVDKLRKKENVVEASIASTFGVDFATGIVISE